MKLRLFLAASLATVLAGCSSVSAVKSGATENRFTIHGTLRFSDGEDIAGLNLHIVPQVSVAQLSQLTGAYLTRFDDRWHPYPELLERIPSKANGDISKGGLEITFRLRPHLVWSDGAPLTSDDVVFSFNAVNNPKNNEYSRTGFDLITRVSRIDTLSMKVTLQKPYGPFYDTFFSSGNLPLLPKHLLGNLSDINSAPYNALPIGAGPFKYVSWKRNEAVTMVANDKYFRGRPKVDKIIYKIIPDWNTVQTQVKTGEIDLALLIPSHIADRTADTPGYKLLGQPSGLRYQMELNVSRKILADVRVRQALRLATDRKALLQKVENGHGYLDESVIGPLSPNALVIPPLPYDQARAAALLDQAGWKLGSDGIRVKDGVPLALEISTITGSPARDNWALLIQTWWKQAGVKVSIKHYPPSVLFGPYSAGGIFSTGKYDIGMSGQGYGYAGDLSAILACNQFPPGGFNTTHFCNQKLDSLMTAFNGTYEPAEAKRISGDVQRIIADDVPIVVLFIPQDNYVYNTDLKGFTPVANLDGAFRWSI